MNLTLAQVQILQILNQRKKNTFNICTLLNDESVNMKQVAVKYFVHITTHFQEILPRNQNPKACHAL